MPFDPNYNYTTGFDGPSHVSVPPNGRRVVTADFALMYINNSPIGVVQRFTPTESRPVAPQFEIGNIYPVEFIPQPWQGSIQVQRLEIFKNQLYKAFGFDDGIAAYGLSNYWPQDKVDQNGNPIVTSLADIQWPLNLSIHIENPPVVNSITVKNYIECWITQSGTSYDAGAKVVAENVQFVYRNVTFTSWDLSSSIQTLAQLAV